MTNFEDQVVPLRKSLGRVALRLTRDPVEAEDLVQDTMVRALRFWGSFEQGSNLKAWMFTILKNTFKNGYHRRGRERNFKGNVSAQVRSLGPTVAIGNTTSEPPGPEEAVSARVTQARIREALDEIPDDYRLAVELADLEGFAYKEIATVMDCPIGTVMSRIYRGRKLLYKLLYDLARERGLVDDVDPLASGRPSTRGLNREALTAEIAASRVW